MDNERHEAGDVVPREICPASNSDDVRFAVSVDVFGGYGSAKHVYPTKQVESTADLFGLRDEEEANSVTTDDVYLYTIPHEMLR